MARFGAEIVTADGELDRAGARLVSSSRTDEARGDLEAIVHPEVRVAWPRSPARARHRRRGRARPAVDRDGSPPRLRRWSWSRRSRRRRSPARWRAAWTRRTSAPGWPPSCRSRTRRRSPTCCSTTRGRSRNSRHRSTGSGQVELVASTIRAVLFDAGETLVHPAPSFPELFSQVLDASGHTRDEADRAGGVAVVLDRFSEAAREHEAWTLSPEASRAFWIDVYQRDARSRSICRRRTASARPCTRRSPTWTTTRCSTTCARRWRPSRAAGSRSGSCRTSKRGWRTCLARSGDPERVPGPRDQRPGGDGETRSRDLSPWRWSVSDCRRIRWRSWGTIPSSTSFRRWRWG